MATTLILQTLTHALEFSFYALADGHFVRAAFVYAAFFALQLFNCCIALKFTLLTYERHRAYEKRFVYENSDATLAQRLILTMVCFLVLRSHTQKKFDVNALTISQKRMQAGQR